MEELELFAKPVWGWDDLSLIDLPLAVYGPNLRGQKRTGPREVAVSVYNVKQKKSFHGKLTIYHIDDGRENRLAPYDEDVFIALLKLTSETGFLSREVVIPRSSLIFKLLGWTRSGNSYTKLDKSMTRLVGLMLETDVYYDRITGQTVKRKFHIIDEFQQSVDGNGMSFKWSDTVWDNFKHNGIKPFNITRYSNIENPVAKKLYRALDKRLYIKNKADIPLNYISHTILGMSPKSRKVDMREVIDKAAKELLELNYLKECVFYLNDKRTECYLFIKPDAAK